MSRPSGITWHTRLPAVDTVPPPMLPPPIARQRSFWFTGSHASRIPRCPSIGAGPIAGGGGRTFVDGGAYLTGPAFAVAGPAFAVAGPAFAVGPIGALAGGAWSTPLLDCPLTYVKFGSIPKVVLPTDEVGM